MCQRADGTRLLTVPRHVCLGSWDVQRVPCGKSRRNGDSPNNFWLRGRICDFNRVVFVGLDSSLWYNSENVHRIVVCMAYTHGEKAPGSRSPRTKIEQITTEDPGISFRSQQHEAFSAIPENFYRLHSGPRQLRDF